MTSLGDYLFNFFPDFLGKTVTANMNPEQPFRCLDYPNNEQGLMMEYFNSGIDKSSTTVGCIFLTS